MKHYQPLKTKKDSQKMKKNISYQTIQMYTSISPPKRNYKKR